MYIFLSFLCYFAFYMMSYSIEVKEILCRRVEVLASHEDEALNQVRKMYRDCTIVLDASDYERTEFRVKDEKHTGCLDVSQ